MPTPLRPRGPSGSVRRQMAGQSLVEFALVLPILALLLLGTLDAGRLFMSWITLNNVVRVAANYAASDPNGFSQQDYADLVNREDAGLNCAVQADASGNNPPLPTYPSGTSLSGSAVAAMSCKFTLLTPLMASLFGGPITMSSSAQFPIRSGAIANVSGSTTLPPPGALQASFSFVNVSGGTIDGSGNVTGTAAVTVNVLDQSSNAQTYEWDFGDAARPDTQYTNQPNPHTYTLAGTYTVTLTVSNTSGSQSAQRTVIVTSAPPAPVAGFYGTGSATYVNGGGAATPPAPILATIPLSVAFANTSTGGTSYSWDFGDGSPTDTTDSPAHTYNAYGTFTVTLTVTAPSGGNPYSISQYVQTGCVVPTFSNTFTSAAANTWSNAGWTGQVTYLAKGSKGAASKSPPNPAKKIEQQSLTGGTFLRAVNVTTGSNKGWQCADDIMLTYLP
jgi:PKD repeat protein